jgi:transcription-repair coupling factor (superfamily II helicase)
MSILTESIRRDGEYKQLLRTLENDFRLSPLPILASGLCDGAADAFLVSLLTDSKSYRGGTALLLCPEEKDCVRISGTLERYGIRTAFYMARDLTFYNITASHEYEHERLRVLSGLIAGDYDVVVTTPDAVLGYTVPPDKLKQNHITVEETDTVETKEFT